MAKVTSEQVVSKARHMGQARCSGVNARGLAAQTRPHSQAMGKTGGHTGGQTGKQKHPFLLVFLTLLGPLLRVLDVEV
uniref:Uncharacterized protein n=1 Tax=Anguilla anguilla TaxID=7936 RepID=A0A0E9WTR1_ANGAN